MAMRTAVEAGASELVDMTWQALTKSEALRAIRGARERLVARGDLDAPLDLAQPWRLLRQ